VNNFFFLNRFATRRFALDQGPHPKNTALMHWLLMLRVAV
jgi:hypothetical protein